MPIYNSARYIAEAIESVLAQSWEDFELIIVDDASSDGTAEIAASYAERDSRIRFRVNASNMGMVTNWNCCLAEASGGYVKFLFGDDLLAPEALNRMATILDEDPAVSLVSSARALIDEFSRPTDLLVHFATGTYDGTEVIKRCIFEEMNYVGEPSAVMFRKSRAGRGFDPALKQIVDLEMWFHLLEQGRFAYIQEPLCSFRRHSEQMTIKNEKDLTNFREFFVLTEMFLRKSYARIGWWGTEWYLFEKYYAFWKRLRDNAELRDIAVDIIWSQYGKRKYCAMMVVYKLYNPLRKLYNTCVGAKKT